MTQLKVTAIGNSIGIILPKEVATRLRVSKGSALFVTETPRGIELTPYDPEFDKQVEAGRRAMQRYKNALRKLAE